MTIRIAARRGDAKRLSARRATAAPTDIEVRSDLVEQLRNGEFEAANARRSQGHTDLPLGELICGMRDAAPAATRPGNDERRVVGVEIEDQPSFETRGGDDPRRSRVVEALDHALLTKSGGLRGRLLFGASGLFALGEEGIIGRLLRWLCGDPVCDRRLLFIRLVIIVVAEAFVFAEE